MTIQRTIDIRCDGTDEFSKPCRRVHCGLHTTNTKEARFKTGRWGWSHIEGKDLCPDCGNVYYRRKRSEEQVAKFNERFKPGEVVRHRPHGVKGEVYEVELESRAYVTEDGFARTRTSGPGGFYARLGNISKIKK